CRVTQGPIVGLDAVRVRERDAGTADVPDRRERRDEVAGRGQREGGVDDVVAGRGERRNGGVDRCRACRVHVQPVGRRAGEHADPQPWGWVHGHRGGEGRRRGGGGPPRGRVV